MKKIFFLILIFICFKSFGQFPGVQGISSPTTRLIVNGGLDASKGLINGIYSDTTAANAGNIDFYTGSQIYTRSDGNFWIRDTLPMRWSRMARFIEAGAGSGIVSLGNVGNWGLVLVNDSTYRADTSATGLVTQFDFNVGLDSKLNISDTSAMLASYIHSSGWGLIKAGQGLKADTALLATVTYVQSIVGGGGYTDEQAQDASAALFTPDDGDIDYTYNDLTPSITSTIKADAVTLAKMADVATGTVFYRKTAATGNPEVQTLATLKTDLGLTGTNSGDQTTIVGITGTKAEFNTSLTDGDFVFVSDTTAMLASYIHSPGWGTLEAGQGLKVDSSVIQKKLIFAESVIKSGDSVYLRGEKDLTVSDREAYSKINNLQGWNPVAIINEVLPGEGHLLKFDSLNNQWTNFKGDSLIGFQYWRVGVTPFYPDGGDTEIIDSNFMGRNVAVYYDHQRLHPDLDYTHNEVTGEIQFNFVLQDSVPVVIETYSYLTSSILGRRTAVAPAEWEDIDFETNTNLTESPANVWTASTGAGWGQTGLNDAKKILTGTECAYRTQITATSNWKYIMGIGTDDAQVGYASFTSGMLTQYNGSNWDIYRTSGASTFDTGFDLDIGDYVALWRYADGTVVIRKSTDGVNWIDVYSYGVVSTADMFFKIDVNYTSGGAQQGVVVNPMVINAVNQ